MHFLSISLQKIEAKTKQTARKITKEFFHAMCMWLWCILWARSLTCSQFCRWAFLSLFIPFSARFSFRWLLASYNSFNIIKTTGMHLSCAILKASYIPKRTYVVLAPNQHGCINRHVMFIGLALIRQIVIPYGLLSWLTLSKRKLFYDMKWTRSRTYTTTRRPFFPITIHNREPSNNLRAQIREAAQQ